jgi:RNA polymerase sigma-70 factor (family 1)
VLVPSLDNETVLLSRITEGDEAAFSLIFRHYSNSIYNIAYKFAGCAAVSEEIVQDVFLKIWMKRSGLMNINDFRAYLFVVTRNHIYTVLKRKASKFKTISLNADSHLLSYNDTDNRVMEKEYGLLLKEAVESLSAQQQKVYILIKEQGLKREEVAGLLEIHPETIKTHLSHALRNIRTYCMLHSDIHLGILICIFVYFYNFQ